MSRIFKGNMRTQLETNLLAKDLNFPITSKTLPNKNTIATIEDAVKELGKEETDTIRAKVSLTFENSNPPKDNLIILLSKAY